MNEKAFYSKNFTLRCPVLVLVDSRKFAKENAGAVLLLSGNPGLGSFLPLFVNRQAVGSMADTIDALNDTRRQVAAAEIKTPKALCKIIKVSGEKNVVVYLKKNRVRFYRAEDLIEEVQGYARN